MTAGTGVGADDGVGIEAGVGAGDGAGVAAGADIGDGVAVVTSSSGVSGESIPIGGPGTDRLHPDSQGSMAASGSHGNCLLLADSRVTGHARWNS